jgi:hypothetical protein
MKKQKSKQVGAHGRRGRSARPIDFASKHSFSFSSHKFSFLKNHNLHTQL